MIVAGHPADLQPASVHSIVVELGVEEVVVLRQLLLRLTEDWSAKIAHEVPEESPERRDHGFSFHLKIVRLATSLPRMTLSAGPSPERSASRRRGATSPR